MRKSEQLQISTTLYESAEMRRCALDLPAKDGLSGVLGKVAIFVTNLT